MKLVFIIVFVIWHTIEATSAQIILPRETGHSTDVVGIRVSYRANAHYGTFPPLNLPGLLASKRILKRNETDGELARSDECFFSCTLSKYSTSWNWRIWRQKQYICFNGINESGRISLIHRVEADFHSFARVPAICNAHVSNENARSVRCNKLFMCKFGLFSGGFGSFFNVRERHLKIACLSFGMSGKPIGFFGNYHLDKAAARDWNALANSYVSLWDLIQFSVRGFWDAMQLIEQEAGICALAAQANPNAIFPAEWDERFNGNLAYIKCKGDEIQCDAAGKLAIRILEMARQRMPLAVINIQLHTLKGILEDDARERMFSYIPQSERALLLQVPAQWQLAWSKFPVVQADSEKGTEAYAHGLYEASVFHMMLILEKGLIALANRLVVKRGVKE